ncbi:hypothetical protein FOC4_h10016808, partial [Fusarium odoratissimum]
PSLSSQSSVTLFSVSSGIRRASSSSRMLYIRCLLQYSSSSTRSSLSISSTRSSSSDKSHSLSALRRHKRPPK